MKVVFIAGGLASGKSTILRALLCLGAGIAESDVIIWRYLLESDKGRAYLKEMLDEEVPRLEDVVSLSDLRKKIKANRPGPESEKYFYKHVLCFLANEIPKLILEDGTHPYMVIALPPVRPEWLKYMLDLLDAELIVVSAPEEVQLNRLMSRGKYPSKSDAMKSLNKGNRWLKKLASVSDYQINNDGDIDDLLTKVEKLNSSLLSKRGCYD